MQIDTQQGSATSAKPLKLYLLSRIASVGYDEHDAAVVSARSPWSARKLMNAHGVADENWCSAQFATCRAISDGVKAHVKEGIVVASFNAG